MRHFFSFLSYLDVSIKIAELLSFLVSFEHPVTTFCLDLITSHDNMHLPQLEDCHRNRSHWMTSSQYVCTIADIARQWSVQTYVELPVLVLWPTARQRPALTIYMAQVDTADALLQPLNIQPNMWGMRTATAPITKAQPLGNHLPQFIARCFTALPWQLEIWPHRRCVII